jgi:Zn-dependent alcohol dehydrogenase
MVKSKDGEDPMGDIARHWINGEWVTSDRVSESLDPATGRALASERNTVRIPDDMPLELVGPLGCGLQTGAGAVLNSLRVRPGESLAVFGTGSVGLAAVMAAKVAGATTVVAVDVNETRLALAAELGATHAVNASTDDIADRMRRIRPGGFDYVLEITARPHLLALAVQLLAPMGVAALIGAAPAGTTATLRILLVVGRHADNGVGRLGAAQFGESHELLYFFERDDVVSDWEIQS